MIPQIIEKELENSFFTGAQWWTSKDCLVRESGFSGFVSEDSDISITEKTFFDTASLTKALFTLPCIYKLIQSGEISGNTPVQKILPELKPRVSIYELFSHRSGFPAWIPLYEHISETEGKSEKRFRALKCFNSLSTGKKNKLYSDINYIILGFVIESVYSTSLPEVKKELFSSLGFKGDIRFSPEMKKNDICASTMYSEGRKRVCSCEVEDENSHILGGAAGHAGLFSSAKDTGELVNCLMKSSWFREMLEKYSGEGLDRPEGDSHFGSFNREKYSGHLGFTGTAFLMNPENFSAAVLFTNRTHPFHEKKDWKKRIKRVRKCFFNNCFPEK